MSIAELPYCTFSYEKPIVRIQFKENTELDVKEMRELIAITKRITGGKPYLLLSVTSDNVLITSEARKVAADRQEAPLLVANAVVTNSLAMKLTANFFVKFNKPHFRFRAFTDEASAAEWLLRFDPEKQIKGDASRKAVMF